MARTWVTGVCWRCDGADEPVMWIGDVQHREFGHAPFFACEPCIRRLEALMRAYCRAPERR